MSRATKLFSAAGRPNAASAVVRRQVTDVDRAAQIQIEGPDGNPVERRRAQARPSRPVGYLLAVAAALLGWFGLAAKAAAQASLDAGGGIGTTPGRSRALVTLAVALIGVALGGRALARSAGRVGPGRGGAIVAMAVGLVGTALGGLHAASSTGAIGTGSGRGGAIVAMVVGLIGVALGGLALTRSRRAG